MNLMERLAGAPISWGVCEVPGWGIELTPDRVLSEMRQLGLTATEIGADGYLPSDPGALRELLRCHELQMIGGFVPLVIHIASQERATIDAAHRAARLMSDAGGTIFVTAAVADWNWGPHTALDASEWRRSANMLTTIDEIVGEYGMTQAIHPHLNTILETRDEIQQLLEVSDVGWTLDTGHMLIGGQNPLEFVTDAFDRIRHVHLKDVHLDMAAPVLAGRQSIMEGVQAGMFCNLGQGDVPIADVVRELEISGYDHWYVLEQDAAITTGEPEVGSGPLLDVQTSIEYLKQIEASSRQPGTKHLTKGRI
jgi:inosose dehydratase